MRGAHVLLRVTVLVVDVVGVARMCPRYSTYAPMPLALPPGLHLLPYFVLLNRLHYRLSTRYAGVHTPSGAWPHFAV